MNQDRTQATSSPSSSGLPPHQLPFSRFAPSWFLSIVNMTSRALFALGNIAEALPIPRICGLTRVTFSRHRYSRWMLRPSVHDSNLHLHRRHLVKRSRFRANVVRYPPPMYPASSSATQVSAGLSRTFTPATVRPYSMRYPRLITSYHVAPGTGF